MKIYCPKCKKPFPAAPPAEGEKEAACPVCGEKVAYPATPTSPGAVVGDFLIEREISRGGMGEVYLARQLSLDRPVALKVLQDRFVHDKEYVDSLTREARAAAKINHPNIVQAYAVGEEDGIFYFAMEFIRGETLKQILKREKKLDFLRAAKIIQEIAGALDVAWREQKLVHQDIKPDNIMLDANGFAKLADLGLARTAGAGDADAEVGDEVMGTPQYISPEQLTGVPTDVRSDIYSLGATFYQFVTGRFPYVAPTADEIAKMHVAGKLTPPKEINPELPDELNAIIMKMMARDINARYQTPGPLIKALELFQQNHRSATGAIPTLNLKGGKGNAAPVLQLPKKKNAAPKPAAPQQPSMPVRTMPSMPVKPTRPGGAAATLPKPAAAQSATPPKAAPQPSMPLKHMPSMPVKPMARPNAVKPAPAGNADAAPAEKQENSSPSAANVPPTPEVKAPGNIPKVPTPEVKAPGSVPKVPKPAVKVAEPAVKVTEPAVKTAEPAVKSPSLPPKSGDLELKVVSKAPEEDDEIVGLKGEAANEEAPEETKGKKPRKEKKPKKPREPMSPRVKKILITAVGIFVLLLILVGLTGGVYILARKDQLPEAAKPHGEKLVAAVDDLLSRIKPLFVSSESDETEQTGSEGELAQQPQQPQQSPAPAKPEPPPPPPPPQTRQEYLAAVEAALQIIRNDPEMRNEFLTAGDRFFERFPRPVTQEERAALQPLLDVYGRMDEVHRAEPARKKAREQHEAALAERRRRQQAEQEAEAARREAAEQERARAAEEQRKLAEELQAKQAEEQRVIDARTAEVRKAVEAYYPALYRGFFRQVFSGESDVLDAAVAAAGAYQLDFANNSPGEKALAEQLKSTTATIRSEAERLRNALVTLESVTDQKNGFNIELPHNELVRVVCAVPGRVSYRNDDGELVLLPMTNPAVYRTYMSRVASRLKLNLTDFEYALFAGEYPTAARLLPEGFWKQHWTPMLTEYFRETLKTATPEQRATMEKRYGEMPEFKAAAQP